MPVYSDDEFYSPDYDEELKSESQSAWKWVVPLVIGIIALIIAMIAILFAIFYNSDGQTGPTGPTGPTGRQGDRGSQGIQGPKGDNSLIVSYVTPNNIVDGNTVRVTYDINNPVSNSFFVLRPPLSGQNANMSYYVNVTNPAVSSVFQIRVEFSPSQNINFNFSRTLTGAGNFGGNITYTDPSGTDTLTSGPGGVLYTFYTLQSQQGMFELFGYCPK